MMKDDPIMMLIDHLFENQRKRNLVWKWLLPNYHSEYFASLDNIWRLVEAFETEEDFCVLDIFYQSISPFSFFLPLRNWSVFV